ncbi:MAG: hypothetical protein II208_03205 [Alphaproteobacteria bacterium]|nr:hypothetical protein [Alphaproteobacteria bacterium]
MIDKNVILSQIGGRAALWCAADMDAGDLAQAVGVLDVQGLNMMSVAPGAVATVWPWLEEKNTKIYARFYFPDKRVSEKQVSDVTVQINNVFKHGAHGAQIFLRASALPGLVEQTHVIRDDLFFDKDLIIGLDVSDVDVDMWDSLFANLRKINASAVMFVLTKDMGDKSDFVGRIYAMLNAWTVENKFNLHFAFGPNFMRIEQALRMTHCVKPELDNRLCFWLNY